MNRFAVAAWLSLTAVGASIALALGACGSDAHNQSGEAANETDQKVGGLVAGSTLTTAYVTSGDSGTAQAPPFGNSAVPVRLINENGGCLDLPGGVAQDTAQLQIWACNATGTNQTWYMDSIGAIHYGADPNFCVDLPSGGAVNNARLQLRRCDGRADGNQVWIYEVDNTIHKATSISKCVELLNGSSANGNAVQLYECNGTSGQRWSPLPTGTPRVFGSIAAPVQLMDANGGCLDLPSGETGNGTLLHIWECNTTGTNQLWYMDKAGAIHYGADSTKCVDLPNGNPANNARLQLWDCDYGASGNQVWTYGVDNTIRKSGSPNKCVELFWGSSANGNAVQLYDCNGTSGQRWSRFMGTAAAPVMLTNTNGGCLDLPSGNTQNGTELKVWACNSATQNQKWYVDGAGAIHYAAAPGKCIDSTTGGIANGTPLQLWDCAGAGLSSQTWWFEGDGTIQRRNACIELLGGSSANGNAVQLFGCNGTTGQKWSPRY